jgi:hypothetical protein
MEDLVALQWKVPQLKMVPWFCLTSRRPVQVEIVTTPSNSHSIHTLGMLMPTFCESSFISLLPYPPPSIRYLDQPRYVGYSYGYGQKVKSSVEAADDFITFYEGWLDLFPEFKGRELIISGESYGGHYVSHFSLLPSLADHYRFLLGRMRSWISMKIKLTILRRSILLVQ